MLVFDEYVQPSKSSLLVFVSVVEVDKFDCGIGGVLVIHDLRYKKDAISVARMVEGIESQATPECVDVVHDRLRFAG